MTKSEIIEKANSYKKEYNIQNFNVGKYQQTLNFLNRYKNFFSVRAKKTSSLKNALLITGLVSSVGAGLLLLSSLLASFPLLITSIIVLERFFFFNSVNKKFNKCTNYFENLTKKISEKEIDCINQQHQIMSQIIALENEIPDDIKETLIMLEETENFDIGLEESFTNAQNLTI